ncbi:MAG: MFS transporter [Promethearchaeota archaeon]
MSSEEITNVSSGTPSLEAFQAKYKPRMKPNKPGKLKYGRTFLIGLAFMTSSIAWTYYNFMMPLLLKEYFLSMGVINAIDTLVGVVMVLDNIIAILLLPVFGALSDRTESKLGKRTPFILIGSASAIIAFSVVGFVSSSRGAAAFAGLIAIVMWFNMSMAFYRSSSVSLMPDLTDPEVRSTGNAIINLMGAVSMVIGLSASGIMGGIYDTRWIPGQDAARAGGFYFVSILTAAALIILLLTIKETPTGDKFLKISESSIAIDPVTLEYLGEQKTKEKEPLMKSLKDVFTAKEKSPLYMLMVIFTWFFGYNAIDTFYSLYSTQFLGWEEGAASTALQIAPMTMILTAVFAGKIAEKIGRKKTIFIGLIGLSATFLVSMFIKTPGSLTIFFGIIGVFYGFININTIVIIWEMAPKGKIGAYTGAYYFFSQLSATISPVFAGATFDLYKNLAHIAEGQQYILMFPYLIFWEIVAMFFLYKVKRGESKTFNEKQVADLREEYEQED